MSYLNIPELLEVAVAMPHEVRMKLEDAKQQFIRGIPGAADPFFAVTSGARGVATICIMPSARVYFNIQVLIDRELEIVPEGRITCPPSPGDREFALRVLETLFISNSQHPVLRDLFWRDIDGVIHTLPVAEPFVEAIATLDRLKRMAAHDARAPAARHEGLASGLSAFAAMREFLKRQPGALPTAHFSDDEDTDTDSHSRDEIDTPRQSVPVLQRFHDAAEPYRVMEGLARCAASSDGCVRRGLKARKQGSDYSVVTGSRSSTAADRSRHTLDIHRMEPSVLEPGSSTPAEKSDQEGDHYYRQGKLQDALVCYKKAQQHDPTQVIYIAKEASIYLWQNEYDAYTTACDRALTRMKRAADEAEKWCDRGEEFLRDLEYREAKLVFDKALLVCPFYARGFAGRSMVHMVTQQYFESVRDAERAIALDERNALAWCCKGFSHLILQQFEEAKVAAEWATKFSAYLADYDNSIYQMLKCLVHVEIKDFRSALVCAQEAIRTDPSCSNAWITKGNCHLKLKEYHLAKQACDKALQLSPTLVWCHSTRAFVLLELRDYKGALADADAAVALDPEYGNAWNAKALTHYHMREYRKAKSASDTAIAANPTIGQSFSIRALISLALNETDLALRDAEHALGIDGTDARGWRCKAQAHCNLHQYVKAIVPFRRALELEPDDGETKDSLAAVMEYLK
eukprot:Protomagalhaensia_sp_Gyna_25__6052@NODE_960_length_2352_cov_19_345006_g763_i0_p1_GENE_NODE_960_length_2352_cov_19_345006_g763_i0NODE_960_length_2352_cov_19_345006_g763_i0_p1_ORF_typecomplete_len687_score114_24TPR_16/PF13432_6/0_00075TPR_16/PF13432_6/1e02TPR_16/PF13432_6/0_011TPR_16/PF13432_6/7_1e09TPR_16/PF13432_6/5_7e08TPR_16/PF13432_6/0_00058TPR_9/PF13371_6/2_1e02TPR_9/PF13371_6/49TPR_9/PF13371_6/0_38TPR_9/PF13371_6/0_15TPR_9/PF13371_6/0_00032TPR_9/PF13371_6/1_7e07TPR_9/PF13371_6/2e07TPR_2/PF0